NDLPHNRRRDYDFLKGYSFEQSLARNLTKATSASAVNAVAIEHIYKLFTFFTAEVFIFQLSFYTIPSLHIFDF
ncbi:MAG: hypothetical protein U5K72_04930, partial [Balneolaceae bacterium]|nr:hypothetical protein [Balneolaceae bacterium]